MKNFALLANVTNRNIWSDVNLLYFPILETENHGLMKLLLYFPILQTVIYGLLKNFAVLSYLANRDIWSDEEFCCTVLSSKRRYMV